MKKGIVGILLACLLALSVGIVGCGGSSNATDNKEDPNEELLIGTWELATVAINGVELEESLVPGYLEEVGEFTITFKAGGKASATFQGMTGPCTYTFDGVDGVLIEQGEEMPFTLDDGRIGMDQDGATLYFTMK